MRSDRTRSGGGGIVSAQQGSLLVVTLWLIITLAMLAAALGNYLSSEATLTRYHRARAQAKAWARAGIYLALERLALDGEEEPGKSYDWLGDEWAFGLGSGDDPSRWTVPMASSQPGASLVEGAVTIQITDEERKLDLHAPLEGTHLTLARLTRLVGDEGVAQAIFDYQDSDTNDGDQGMQPPYEPKNTLFVVPEELWEIPAVMNHPELSSVLSQHGSVYGRALVNINTATAEVLKALVPDGSQDSAIDTLVNGRAGPDRSFATPDDDCRVIDQSTAAEKLGDCFSVGEWEPWKKFLDAIGPYDVASSVFRITVQGVVTRPSARAQIEAVVQRGTTEGRLLDVRGVPFRVIAWRES